MNKREYDRLCNDTRSGSFISVDELIDKSDRTLLYGYTCERLTWHVYLEDGVIHKVVYRSSGGDCEHSYYGEGFKVWELIPDKRLYPETCDFEFCSLLRGKGVDLLFTNFNEDRGESQYYGWVVEDKE
jgi:hypothetical protein